MSVGVDAALSPAKRNRKIAPAIGEIAKRPVGADDPVRPWGNDKFAATYRKNGRAVCGESAASTPTNVVRVCIGASAFVGASCRADRGVRPYRCVRVCIGAVKFVIFYRAGGVKLRPRKFRKFYEIADRAFNLASACCTILQSPSATAPFTQGSLRGRNLMA